jgi:hypothetical protein
MAGREDREKQRVEFVQGTALFVNDDAAAEESKKSSF